MINYLACKFTKQTLSNLIKESFGADFPFVFDKKQIDYIVRYLEDLGAKSVVLEKNYLDKDFLEDHSRYYVKCYNNHGHRCARLHFFAKESVGHEYIDSLLGKGIYKNSKFTKNYIALRDSYLGFVVIKPLPKTFIGKTCLKRYDKFCGGKDRRISLSREYKVDFFGIPLSVQSVAFQEQDRVVSACATTAIWSALHGISWRDNFEIPACSEITTNAINHIDNSSNSFPNNGLTNKQIMRALDVEGLRHHSQLLKDVSKASFLETVKAHIDSKIPLIFGVKLLNSGIDEKVGAKDNGHAITILGYVNDKDESSLYVHDDRFGPFAKAQIIDIEKTPPGWGIALQKKTPGSDTCSSEEILVPDILIIPVYKKVRIPYSMVSYTIRLLFKQMNEAVLTSPAKDLVPKNDADMPFKDYSFKADLRTISEIRQEFIANEAPTLSEIDRINFLVGDYARFQWVVSIYHSGNRALRLLFDATDIPQGNALSAVIIDDKKLSEPFVTVVRKLANGFGDISSSDNDNFYSSLLRYYRKKTGGYENYLDENFGSLRAPDYLKEDEFPDGKIVINQSVKVFYESTLDTIDLIFPGEVNKALWAIGEDGGLIVGLESGNVGHPSLTGFNPARISGELVRDGKKWKVNPYSGRFSRSYPPELRKKYLRNAVSKIRAVFIKEVFTMEKI
ncbi:C39 family peptidase [Azovibrio restrictus]|uniref:C39 family peptidase n=1 Tax=Azovibrio restrictus TaxID=146938 RepID=UPI0026F13273|nr:C39 family peptidase [Azovibrio restrictus]MDD3482355.1 C39 family peptidase [Azovibrio restrictus]